MSINNKIKVLIRAAYGYRNFMNNKKRILIHFKFKPLESKVGRGRGQSQFEFT